MCNCDVEAVGGPDRTVQANSHRIVSGAGFRQKNGFDRRVALKAAAGLGAMAVTGGPGGMAAPPKALAQENGGTRA